MFVTPTIRQAPTTESTVFAFRILGEVTTEDMRAMGAFMEDQFARHDEVSMLVIFDLYDGAERGAALSRETVASRLKALRNVDKYAVVGAPKGPSRAVDWLGKLLPVDARSFAKDEEDAAWRFVGARPN